MKIAIAVDRLVNYGGVERLVSLMAKEFDVDIYTGWYSPDTTFQELKKARIIELISPKSILHKKFMYRLRGRVLQHRFKTLKTPKYDAFVTFGGKSLGIARRHRPCVWHCQAPTRWLYDLYSEELVKFSFPKKQLFQLSCFFLRREDKGNVSRVDKIIAISRNVQRRVKETYCRDSVIAYPPVDTKRFRFNKFGDFYLSSARLTPDKRVDVIVEAFQAMPDKNLVVAGGGLDLERIKEKAKSNANIKVMGWVLEEVLERLYGDCIATIAASLHEDYGLVAIESMAAGKPVIAPGDMGFAETVIDGKTGILLADPSAENVKNAVLFLTPDRCASMRKDCEERAEDFSEEKYIDAIRKALKEVADPARIEEEDGRR